MHNSAVIGGIASAAAARLATAALLLTLGTFLIYGTWFAGSDVLHNAAHDTRHSLAFPCH